MDEQYVGRLVPGLPICDITGEKVGTVARVYRREAAMAAVGAAQGGRLPAPEDVVEVKTGFLGMGKHLYIPLSAVDAVTEEGVFLKKEREELSRQGWETKPPHLDELG